MNSALLSVLTASHLQRFCNLFIREFKVSGVSYVRSHLQAKLCKKKKKGNNQKDLRHSGVGERNARNKAVCIRGATDVEGKQQMKVERKRLKGKKES